MDRPAIVIRLENWGPAAQRKKWMAAYVEGNYEAEHRPPSAQETAKAAQARSTIC